MDKKYVFLLGLSLGLVSSYLMKNTKPAIVAQAQETVECKPQAQVQASNCANEIYQASFNLLYQALDIQSGSLIKGANGIDFNDPRMFLEMMDGFKRGEVCVDYVKEGIASTNCIQRRKASSKTASSENTTPENNTKEIKMRLTVHFASDASAPLEQEDSLLSELLARKGLIPVRDSQTGDISGYTKVTK